MSDANLPPQNPDSSDVTNTPQTNWFVGWDDFASESEAASTEPSLDAMATDALPLVEMTDAPLGAMFDPPSAPTDEPIYAQQDGSQQDEADGNRAAERSAPVWVEHATPHASVDLPAWHKEAAPATTADEVPNVADLISLIQELNQCNNALLDRVSQLEEALDQTAKAQPALMSLMGDDERVAQMQQMAQDLDATRSHATQLFEQLEAAHQSSKRQQILTETLSEQLQNSQERVAQLERECALAQQKYNEQTQLLAQSETARRDLTARLQRQQRYTLQFKAALEKCLEVSPSSLTTILEAIEAQPSGASADLGGATGLPKVQRIRPWSSQSDSQFLGKMSDIISYADSLTDLETLPSLDDNPEPITESAPVAPESEKPAAPVLQLPTGLNSSVNVTHSLTAADAAMGYDTMGDRAAEPSATRETQDELGLSPEVIRAGVEELQAALNDLWGGQPPTDLPQDAEATLWEDLARLIDVSSDDLMKATLSNDFSDLTEPDETLTASPTAEAVSASTGSSTAIVPLSDIPSRVTAPTERDRSPADKAPFLANPSWPSPLVHPLRRPRKLPSLAAVELPRFAN